MAATDQGDPPLSSSTDITIVVKDVNDNAPEFPETEYNISLSEETPRGSQVIVLKAEDKVRSSLSFVFLCVFRRCSSCAPFVISFVQ